MRIGGIFKPNPLVGSFLVGDRFFLLALRQPAPDRRPAQHRTRRAAASSGAEPRARAYANVGVQSRAQFEQIQQTKVNQELGLVYVLLALADRRRADRDRQHADAVGVRAHPRDRPAPGGRDETPPGPGDDPLGGRDHRAVRRRHRHHHRDRARRRASRRSLNQQGITEIAIPYASLIGFLVLAALLGLAAATWPARRAAKLDVLAAIAVE